MEAIFDVWMLWCDGVHPLIDAVAYLQRHAMEYIL